MKIILLTIVLMSIHAAISKHVFYDNLNNCLKDIASNKSVFRNLYLPKFTFYLSYKDIPKDLIVDALVCAVEKDGLFNEHGGLLKNEVEQYCADILTNPDNVIKCQRISISCNALVCGIVCTREEIPKAIACSVNNGILSVLELALGFPLYYIY